MRSAHISLDSCACLKVAHKIAIILVHVLAFKPVAELRPPGVA